MIANIVMIVTIVNIASIVMIVTIVEIVLIVEIVKIVLIAMIVKIIIVIIIKKKMKIVIFEPHPDDLLFGPGPILLDWIKEGQHDIHIITVTDGRACYRESGDILLEDASTMTEDDVAEMRINEAKISMEFLGITSDNHHLLY